MHIAESATIISLNNILSVVENLLVVHLCMNHSAGLITVQQYTSMSQSLPSRLQMAQNVAARKGIQRINGKPVGIVLLTIT